MCFFYLFVIIGLIISPITNLEAESKLHYNYRRCEDPPKEVKQESAKALDKIYIQEKKSRHHLSCVQDFEMEAEAEKERHFFNRMIMAAWGVGLVIISAVVSVLVPTITGDTSEE